MSPEDVTIEGIQEGTHKIEVGEEILLNGKPVTVTSVVDFPRLSDTLTVLVSATSN